MVKELAKPKMGFSGKDADAAAVEAVAKFLETRVDEVLASVTEERAGGQKVIRRT